MTVATFTQPNFTAQLGNTYKGNIDGGMSVFSRIAGAFAPHEQSTPNMTVRVDAGYIFNGGALTEVAAQNCPPIDAPTTNPRIDWIVVHAPTGAVYVVTGVQGASPVAPALPEDSLPIAQVLLQTNTTTIVNSMITDKRLLLARPPPFAGVLARANAAQSLAGSDADNIILLANEDYDTHGAHVLTGNTGRITIPTGCVRAKFFGGVQANFADGENLTLFLTRLGSAGNVNPGMKINSKTGGGVDAGIAFATPWIQNFSAGDYYEMVLRHSAATTLNTLAQGTYFGAEFMF